MEGRNRSREKHRCEKLKGYPPSSDRSNVQKSQQPDVNSDPEGNLSGCRACRTKRMWDVSPGQRQREVGQLTEGGTLLESREAQQGVSAEPTKMLRSIFKHWMRDHKATLKQGQQIRSLLLFSFSDCKGLRISRQQVGEEQQGIKRNFISSQVWRVCGWTSLTELRLGSQTEGTLELVFFL